MVFNVLVDQKNHNLLCFLGSTFMGIPIMFVVKSINLLLAVVTILLMLYAVDLFCMFKVVPIWEFCILVYSMVLLKSCQIFVLRSLVFLTVCSSIILLGFFSFILFKKSHFWA